MRVIPDEITAIELASGKVRVDEEGYLVDPEMWGPEFTEYIANLEGITLTPRYWELIAFMRAYNDEHGIMPDSRHVIKYLAQLEGAEKNAARRLLFEMFPYGYVKQAVKMAGMKQPRAWSTG